MDVKENIKTEWVDLDSLDLNIYNVILDSNFVFITFKYKIDLIRELNRIINGKYKLYIVDSTIKELQKIYDKKKRDKKYLNLVIKFINLYNVRVIKTKGIIKEKYTDDIIYKIVKNKVLVASMDKELRKRIKKNAGRVIVFRQKKYLEIQ